MTDVTVVHLVTTALVLTVKVSAPLLLTALIVGFLISLFQSVTQLQEQTLVFVPKALAVFAALAVAGKWMLNEITSFTTTLYEQIPSLLSGG
ncbi:flagellar biosynthesis protein FliQ [Kineococcus sp. NUM-3379]